MRCSQVTIIIIIINKQMTDLQCLYPWSCLLPSPTKSKPKLQKPLSPYCSETVSPQKLCWNPNPHVTLFADRVSADVIKSRWGNTGLRHTLTPVTGVVGRGKDTQRRRPCEDRGGHCTDAATGTWTQTPPEAGREVWDWFSPTVLGASMAPPTSWSSTSSPLWEGTLLLC